VPELVDLFKAIFLGIIEGLTEFIPVSSTAHLLLSSYLIDFQSIKNNLFEIVIQFGAILAICVIYRKKIWDVIINIKERSQQKFVLNLILAFLPAAIIGGLFHNYIKAIFFSNFVIGISLIIGGIIMIFVEKNKKSEPTVNELEEIKPLKAFYIGIFQSIAMIPGVSRSGATIVGGILLGLKRKTATEFSFFLAIPTIAAASLYDLMKNSAELTTANTEIILIGLLASFLSAILVVKWFINFVSKYSFVGFGVYRIIVGILVLLFIA
jgi:undecaprenyl-diphosphatase